MSKLCERPGCSEVGAAEYGMVPEDLLFWIAPMSGTPHDDQNVLCLRHADAMSVPRGWTLDDRREDVPRLFIPRPRPTRERPARPARPARPKPARAEPVEQLVIDGTAEIERPVLPADEPVEPVEPAEPVEQAEQPAAAPAEVPVIAAVPDAQVESDAPEASDTSDEVVEVGPWQPAFDHDNDLDGLLEVSSPLLARAFRGTDRPRA